jgi:hypothetical protein
VHGEISGRVSGKGALVRIGPLATETAWCELLENVRGSEERLTIGDRVLVVLRGEDRRSGVILGLVRPSNAGLTGESDELVIEARKSLTLRVGESSITLRADGKILIKGKDLVSHAKRMNRIKGGAVSIN